MGRIATWGLVGASLFVLACGGPEEPTTARAGQSSTAGERPGGMMSGSGMQGGGGMMGMHGGGMTMSEADCPMMVPSVRVETGDIDGGAAVTFTTAAPDRVADLRSRVRRMATMMDAGHGEGEHGAGMHAGMAMPASRTSVVDIEGGARLELRAIETAEVDALRTHVREHGDAMRAGACPMMRQMHGATSG